MSIEPTSERRPLLPLLLLHAAAAGVCFIFFTVVPIVGCLVCMGIGDDTGGPMFFPIFVIGVVMFAAFITAVLGGAALTSDLLRRHWRIPLWQPPLAVFALATGGFWMLAGGGHPAVAPVVGIVVAIAFAVHWAAVSAVWFSSRFLFRRLFGARQATANDQATAGPT